MTNTTRTSAAAVAAAAFIVSGASVVGHHVPDQHWGTRGAVLDIAFALGAIAVAVALPAVASLLQAGRAGRAGTRIAQVGYVAIAVECVASTIHGGNTLGPVFMLGLLAAIVGLAILAVGGLRSGAQRALAPLPVIAMLVGIAAGNDGGAIALGIAWAALAAATARTYPAALQPAAA